MFACAFVIMHCALLTPTSAFLYRRQGAPQYLNTERPLWILEDQVRRHDELYSTTTALPTLSMPSLLPKPRALPPPTSLTLYVRERMPSARRRHLPAMTYPYRQLRRPLMTTAMPRHLRLPMPQYVSNRTSVRDWRRRVTTQHTARTRNILASMPIFDSVPGEDNEKPQTVFLYNGPKGELIMNTMLSTQRYPMQEPVPGQVLYPPSTPMFRPKPIVQRFRHTTPGRRQLLNLTLIPFYAHEAINAPNYQTADEDDDVTDKPTTTTSAPTVVYETQLTPAKSTTRKGHGHRRHQHHHHHHERRKKPKQYTAYHSPNEVQWQPPAVELLPLKAAANTTPLATAVTSQDNHRLYTASAYDSADTVADDVEAQANNYLAKYETATLANNNLKPTRDFDFPIIYLNDSVELPPTVDDNFADDDDNDDADVSDDEHVVEAYPETSTDLAYDEQRTPAESRHSSRYALTKEYYAFPVYTLGKLLHSTTETSLPTTTATTRTAAQVKSTQTSLTGSTESNVNTWFILNSRYKGPYKDQNGQYKKNHKKYYTSKYIANNVGSQPLASTTTKS